MNLSNILKKLIKPDVNADVEFEAKMKQFRKTVNIIESTEFIKSEEFKKFPTINNLFNSLKSIVEIDYFQTMYINNMVIKF